ncbi:MAG: hypothetical protein ACOC9T_02035 [Myxococcota bacterium]
MTTKGPKSRENATGALKEAWDLCDELNAERPPWADWIWIPRDAVDVREDILPRELHHDTVYHYKDIVDTLDPIEVQRDTWVLIAGRHRHAAHWGDSHHADHIAIRAIERDIPDHELLLEAIWSNARHGRAYTREERYDNAKRLMERYPEMSDAEIADYVGAGRSTVQRWRSEGKIPSPDMPKRATQDDVSTDSEPVAVEEEPPSRTPSTPSKTEKKPPKRRSREAALADFDWSEYFRPEDEFLEQAPPPDELDPQAAAELARWARDGAAGHSRRAERLSNFADICESMAKNEPVNLREETEDG